MGGGACAPVAPVDEPFVPKLEPEVQKQLLHAAIIERIVSEIGQGAPAEDASLQAAKAAESAACCKPRRAMLMVLRMYSCRVARSPPARTGSLGASR